MEIRVEEVEATRRKITVEVPVEDVRDEMDRALGSLGRRAQVRGFRPGKVPRSVLEQMYGDQVRADVLSHLIERTYAKAIEESGLRPVSPPEVVPEVVERNQPFRYTATVDIRPEIEIGSLDGIEARRVRRPVTDEDVDRALGQVRESLARFEPIEDRDTAEPGDFAAIAVRTIVEGEPEPEEEPETRLVEVGGGSLPEPLEAVLPGLRVGETRQVEDAVPDDHPREELRGRPVRFEITLRALRRKVVPELDDDLAQEHGQYTTLDELRAGLRDRIEEAIRREGDESVRDQVLGEVLRRHPFDVPRSLVDRQLETLLHDLAARSGIPLERLREDPERLRRLVEELRPRAEHHVRAAFVLDAIAEREGTSVTDDEVEDRVEAMAGAAGERAERLRAAYRDPEARADVRARLLRERVLDRIVSVARVEETDASDDIAPPDGSG